MWRASVGAFALGLWLLVPAAAVAADWQYAPRLPVTGTSPGVTTLPDGTVYAVGRWGANPFDGSPFGGHPEREVYALEPGESMWFKRASLPAARANGAVVTYRGRVYVIGGDDATSRPVRSTFIYNPQTDRWSRGVPLPVARDLDTAVVVRGQVYLLGGRLAVGHEATQMLRLDEDNGRWQAVTSLPSPRFGAGISAGRDHEIYMIGGLRENGQTEQYFRRVDRWDPRTGKWTTVAPMPTPREGVAAGLGPDGKIYAIGGANTNIQDDPPPELCECATGMRRVEIYDPTTGEWAVGPPLLEGMFDSRMAVSKGSIYVLGGPGDSNSFWATPERLAVRSP